MKNITIKVNKNEVEKIGNKYRYGKNTAGMNKGDMIEAYLRKFLNPTDEKWYIKNNDAYNVGSDIEANGMKISVKSGEFSLTEKIWSPVYTEQAKQELIEQYAQTVPSDTVAYGYMTETETEYIIEVVIVTMEIFVKFLKVASVMTIIDTKTKRYKVKVKRTPKSVIKTFMELGA